MKKQLLSLIAASLMFSGVSQVNAMNPTAYIASFASIISNAWRTHFALKRYEKGKQLALQFTQDRQTLFEIFQPALQNPLQNSNWTLQSNNRGYRFYRAISNNIEVTIEFSSQHSDSFVIHTSKNGKTVSTLVPFASPDHLYESLDTYATRVYAQRDKLEKDTVQEMLDAVRKEQQHEAAFLNEMNETMKNAAKTS